MTGETGIRSAGCPCISDHSFQLLSQYIPDPERGGLSILRWLRTLEGELELAPGRSWLEDVRRKGRYGVLEEFSWRSRAIYPYERRTEENPSISGTYFCAPRALADQPGIPHDER